MRALPNMTVVAPGDGVEVRKAMQAIVAYDGPVYLRLTRDPSPVVFDDAYEFRLGRAALVREGSDVTVITTGIMLGRAVEAADVLAAEGVSVHLLHVHTVKPLDVEAVADGGREDGPRRHRRGAHHHRRPRRRRRRGARRAPADADEARRGRRRVRRIGAQPGPARRSTA